jgi:membrane-associated phospholipid phosphatase
MPQLESKWALEYGMPSTHAMVGLAVPFSILVFTYGRYQVGAKAHSKMVLAILVSFVGISDILPKRHQ